MNGLQSSPDPDAGSDSQETLGPHMHYPDSKDRSAELLRLERLDVAVADLQPLARTVTLASVELTNPTLSVRRDAEGRIDLIAARAAAPAQTPATAGAASRPAGAAHTANAANAASTANAASAACASPGTAHFQRGREAGPRQNPRQPLGTPVRPRTRRRPDQGSGHRTEKPHPQGRRHRLRQGRDAVRPGRRCRTQPRRRP